VVEEVTRQLSIAAGGGAERLFDVFRDLDEADIPVDDIAMRRPTLDDVFLALTGRATEDEADAGMHVVHHDPTEGATE